MTRRQSYDAATPYYGEPQPYEKEIAKLKAEVARAEEAAGDFQELERINTELAHNLSTAKKQAGAWLNATADAKLEITRLRADLAAVTEERDRMREALMPFDGFPLHKWDGIGDDHALYGPFTLGHVRKYLSASCQGLIDSSNYLEKPDSCARAAIEGVTEPESPKAETAFFVLDEFAPLPEPPR